MTNPDVFLPGVKKTAALPALNAENKKARAAAKVWDPDDSELACVKKLAELGWSALQIADGLDVTRDQFAGAVMRCPELKQAYDEGAELCRTLPERRLSWRPLPSDLVRVKEHAEKGLRPKEIAAKLGVPRTAFLTRLEDTPSLKDAFEEGNGLFRAGLIEQARDLRESRSEDLKYVSSLLIHQLKSYCEFSEKPDEGDKQNGPIQVQVQHTLVAPKTIAVDEVEKFAAAEMERAKAIGAAHTAQIAAAAPATEAIIEAEVREVAPDE